MMKLLARLANVSGLLVLIAVTGASNLSVAQSYGEQPEVQAFIAEMESAHGFKPEVVQAILAKAQRQQKILDAIARPAEKTKPWKDYRKIFVTDQRAKLGVAFWQENRAALARAEQTYGVPAAVIVAILGVETKYGKITGSYRVLDALSTLAFDYPPRSAFFRRELTAFLLLAKEQGKAPETLTGSYAGAMGYGQFMPSSYRAYAVDFDNDGFIDIWHNTTDAIGSVANYFARHGWRPGEPVVVPVQASATADRQLLSDDLKPALTASKVQSAGFSPVTEKPLTDPVRVFELDGEAGPELWLGLHNFYVITRYNHSTLYALSVWQLSQMIAEAMSE